MQSSKHARLADLIRVARELASNKPFPELFQKVIDLVCDNSGADGGSLYIYDSKYELLKAVLLSYKTLGLRHVVDEFDSLTVEGFAEVPLSADGKNRAQKISAAAFLQRQAIMLPELAEDLPYDLSDVRAFDQKHQYTTHSIIALPLQAQDAMVGVLLLSNPSSTCFAEDYLSFSDALASQIAISLNHAMMVKEGQNLLSAMVQMIGVAIDEKSSHTSGHCYRVTELTMMLADAAEAETGGTFADFHMTPTQREELRMAALLHDVGKVITPSHILDKATKLSSLRDRIEHLSDRLWLWHKDHQLSALKQTIRDAGRDDLLAAAAAVDDEQIFADIDFLKKINNGGSLSDDDKTRLEDLAQRVISRSPSPNDKEAAANEKVMRPQDLADLQIVRGTLNPEERRIMEEHVSLSIRLLSSIPWPRQYARLVEYAGDHHEKMDGTGYPNQLEGKDLSMPSRILGLADRFEGLTASDRPYRRRHMTLSQVLKIMQDMSDHGEIDPDLYHLFIRKKLHIEYGKRFVDGALMDVA